MPKNIRERFLAKVSVQPNGCWLWLGCHKPNKQGGYPMFHNVGSPRHAIAVAYELLTGLAAPKRGDGVELSHTCTTGSRCVNPDHVVLETHLENMRRIPTAVKRVARLGKGHKTHCIRGHRLGGRNKMRGSRRDCLKCHNEIERTRDRMKRWVRAVESSIVEGKTRRFERPEKPYDGVLRRTAAPIYDIPGLLPLPTARVTAV
jgi:hypothetical protein